MNNIWRIIGLLALLLSLAGCATCEDCGSIKKLHDVTNIFVHEQIIPGYQYYIYGEDTHPKVILGIDAAYSVEGQFWESIDLTQEKLTEWMAHYRTLPSTGSITYGGYFGFEVLDPNGIRVGVWFSPFDWGVIKFPGNKVIQLSTPGFRPGTGR